MKTDRNMGSWTNKENRHAGAGHLLFLCCLLAAFTLAALFGPASGQAGEGNAPGRALPLEDKWGLKAVSIRLTGADHFVDFRYRVTDPLKAADLTGGRKSPYLIHQPTGKVLAVPITKLGPLRSKAVRPKKGRQYVILFNNSPRIVGRGDKVTVVIGDFRSEELRVK